MKVSVIVPAFNEEKLLGETLRHIRAATAAFAARGWTAEIIVCDNNSTDRTAAIAREAGATVVFEPHNQIARARNTGAAAATGDWFIFVDADSQPDAELFGAVAEQMVSGKCLAGGCTVHLPTERPAAKMVVGLWNAISRVCRWMAGSFVFCDAAAFRQIGGFDEKLFVSEEIDLSRRLKRLARTAKKKIVILHRHPLTTSPRKLHLYSTWEHLGFMARAVLGGGRAMTQREKCFIWYDGRR